jgi:O-antigen/teichoic acid export membrane protein
LITIVLGRAGQFLLALAMMRVATTLLSPAEMGKVSLVLTTTAFFALFLVNPVGMFINRRLHAWQASGIARYYLTRYGAYLLLVALIAGAALTGLYLSGWMTFGISLGWIVMLVCGSLIFNTINQTAIPSLNLLGDSRRFVWLSLLTISASFVFATVLATQVQANAQNWLLGLLLGQTLLALLGAKVLSEHLMGGTPAARSQSLQKHHFHALVRFAWPVALAAGLAWLQGQGYRYLVEKQLGLANLGLFVAGYGISAGIIAGFESVLTTYFQPRLYRDANVEHHPARYAEVWHRYASAVIPSLVLTTACVAMLAPELTGIFLGKDFQSAAAFVIWGAIAEAMRVLMGVYSLIAHVHMQTRWLILPNMLAAVLAILLCLLLMPVYGAAGAGISLALSGVGGVALVHFLLAPHVGGGTALGPVLKVVTSAGALWILTLGVKQFSGLTGWGLVAGTLVPVGTAYLALQYVLLQSHLTDKRKQ